MPEVHSVISEKPRDWPLARFTELNFTKAGTKYNLVQGGSQVTITKRQNIYKLS